MSIEKEFNSLKLQNATLIELSIEPSCKVLLVLKMVESKDHINFFELQFNKIVFVQTRINSSFFGKFLTSHSAQKITHDFFKKNNALESPFIKESINIGNLNYFNIKLEDHNIEIICENFIFSVTKTVKKGEK